MLLIEPKKTQWDLKWSMFGIPVRVHPLFWLVGLLLMYDKDLPFSYVLQGIAMMFVAILVHEFGHALSGRYYGDKHNSIVLYYMGGLCVGSRELPSPRAAIWHSLWGPLAGFILGGIAYATRWALPIDWILSSSAGLPTVYALTVLIWISFVWGAVNLAPVFPLDGGQVFRELVRWKAPHRGDRFVFTVSAWCGFLLAIGFLAKAIYDSQHGGFDNWTLLPVIFFAMLGYSSLVVRRQLQQFDGFADAGAAEIREPWEQDADWWKKS